MKIQRISIQNFRCFKSLDLVLEHCHALVGENGAGKTSVLEAINLATSPGQPYLNEQDFNNADLGELQIEVFFDEPFLVRLPDGYTTQDVPCKSILLSAHRREKAAAGKAFSDSFVTEKYAVPIEYTEGHAPSVPTEGVTTRTPSAIKKTTSGYESPRKSGSPFKFTKNRLTLQNDTINYPNIFYFDRDREEQAKVGYNSVLQKVVKDLNWRYRKEWNQGDIQNKWNEFYNAVISTVDTPKSERIIGPIKDKLKTVAGIDFTDLELGLLEIEQPFSKAFFSKRDGTNQIHHDRFGSGVSILLAYFLLETVSNLSKETLIFLIDEPELHLHPQLQQSLFSEFQKSAYQTIYTTQSDCFINIAEWGSVSRFQKEFEVYPILSDINTPLEEKKLSEHLDEIKKWHQHQSVFFREDNQLLFARKCLLVEGPAELYGIPVLAQKLNKDIGKITIISCNGKGKIPYYQLLCKAFHIPFFTLFDLDGVSDTAPDNKRQKEWAESTAMFTFSSSFEKVFGVSGDHKASETLVKIDAVRPEDIPAEVASAITAIALWAMA